VEAPSGDRGVRAVALSAAGVSYPIVAPARSGTTSAPPGSWCDCASQFRPAASVSGSFTCMRGLTRIAAQSYDAIAEAAGFCRATVVTKLRILEQFGIAETIRRKVVASFTRRVHRVRFDYAVQTSNSYRFNLPIADRSQHGGLALPLLKPAEQVESKDQAETSQGILNTLPADLAAALAGLKQCIESRE
jgi:hypothetical protein